MHPVKFAVPLVGPVAIVMLLSGCGGRPGLKTEYVEGVVTLDGEPVSEATVTFVPVVEGQGMSATGRTDARGVYKLTAVGTGEHEAPAEGGTLPGEYHVGVLKSTVEVPLTGEEAEAQGIEYEGASGGGRPQAPQATHLVPREYNSPRRSGITVTVQEGRNTIPLELTSR